jgi:primosomal protein N' (replication factor Y)
MQVAQVAVPVPLSRAFSYEVPIQLQGSIELGSRVLVELGRRKVLGVVVGLGPGAVDSSDAPALTTGPQLKPILKLVEQSPVLPPELLTFLKEVSAYYFAPLGEVLRLALPAVESRRSQGTGELFEGSTLSGSKKVKVPEELVAAATSQLEEPGALRGQALSILQELRANGPRAVARLSDTWKNARVALKKLEGLGLVELRKADKKAADPFDRTEERVPAPELTEPQATALEAVEASLASGRAQSFLLFGVTGSGKTEVYLRSIARCLSEGRGALVLVPEIALTPQLVSRYRQRFGDDVAVLHSGLADRKRHEMFLALHSGRLRVAIGARSALFGPVQNLGLVIVDEEHDGSFKQEEGVRYHARDMALLRAHRAGATVLLGSATPSLESFELCRRGKATLLELPGRAVKDAVLPTVTLVDLKSVKAGPSGARLLTTVLHREIDKALERKEQTIVFLNRRGHSPAVVCLGCGTLVSCRACSVAMTFHRGPVSGLEDGASIAGGTIQCHYCGYQERGDMACPKCRSPNLKLEGLGTEKLEDTLAAAFPNAKVARLDRDIADTKKGAAVLEGMRDGTIDILVGTQMVTKGHDFPNVTLVGVVNADAALALPEFRASERSFQLLVQVAGRAGRRERPGKVIIQTYSPEHAAIAFAQRHDVRGFLERESADRREAGYPPFRRLALVRVDALDAALAESTARWLAEVAQSSAGVRDGKVEVLGPTPAPLARLRGRYRFRVLLRADDRGPLRSVLGRVDAELVGLDRKVRVVIDVDPVGMM